jgi:hypothetical protein
MIGSRTRAIDCPAEGERIVSQQKPGSTERIQFHRLAMPGNR